jgi:tryptophanyl-tRNA synthetase
VIKRRLEEILQEMLAPIRERRAELAQDPEYVLGHVRNGTERAREITNRTRWEVAEALGLFVL